MTENDTNICKCLFETLLEWDNDCIFIPERQKGDEEPLYVGDKQEPMFDFREALDCLEESIDFEPDFLVLFNNNNVDWCVNPHYEVYRIISNKFIYDMTVLKKYDITIYTNGLSGDDSSFIAMRNREVIMEGCCPITYGDIKEYFYNNKEKQYYEEIRELLNKMRADMDA